MGIRCADHVTPLYPQKLSLNSPTGGGRSVGIVRSRTKATEFFYIYILLSQKDTLHRLEMFFSMAKEQILTVDLHLKYNGNICGFALLLLSKYVIAE